MLWDILGLKINFQLNYIERCLVASRVSSKDVLRIERNNKHRFPDGFLEIKHNKRRQKMYYPIKKPLR